MRRTAKKFQVFGLGIFLSIAKAMAYHQPSGCISSRVAMPPLYLITEGASSFRNDDIQLLTKLMICNSCGIDDIQGLRLDFL